MSAWRYLAESIALGTTCFLLGYLAGHLTRDVHRIAQVATEQGEAMPVRRPRQRLTDRVIAPAGQLVIAVVVVLLGVMTVVQGLVQSAATRRVAQCHATYANQFADAIDARSQASQQAQDALDELMTTFGRAAASPPTGEAELVQRREAARKAITDYVAKRAESKAAQARNPFPKPPREACPN